MVHYECASNSSGMTTCKPEQLLMNTSGCPANWSNVVENTCLKANELLKLPDQPKLGENTPTTTKESSALRFKVYARVRWVVGLLVMLGLAVIS